MKTVTLIPGDGIGPEIVRSVKEIFTAAQVPLTWDEQLMGESALQETGQLMPEALIGSLERHRVGLKGPCTTPIGQGFRSVNVALRKRFQLYANIRPVNKLPGLETRWENVDIVLFRENLEGLYAGLEVYDEALQMADALKRVTQAGSERIIRAAFSYAKDNGKQKVALFHKANILKEADGLFLRVGRQVAEEFPEITLETYIIDNAFMQVVNRPETFEVIVTTNMFGDILSDLLAAMVGGLGVVSGANIGKDCAVFEAVHGTAPDIAGKGIANPTGILLSALQMLRHLNLDSYADNIQNGLETTYRNPEQRTGDVGGQSNTQSFTQHLISNL